MSNDEANIRLHAAEPILQDPVVSSVASALSDFSLTLDSDRIVTAAMSRQQSSFSNYLQCFVGQDFAALLEGDSLRRFAQRDAELKQRAAKGEAAPFRWAELEHRDTNGATVPVRYAMHLIAASGDLLLLGQDQRPVIEMQQQLLNAQIALEQDYETQREMDTRYRLLMDFTSDAVALVSATSGRIIDINHNAASLFGASRADLLDKVFADRFVSQGKTGLIAALSAHVALESPVPIDVELRDTQRHLLLSSKLFRAAGEQLILVRLTDPEFGSVADGRLVANLRQLFYRGPDGMVFTDRDGNILEANETFLNLSDISNLNELRGVNISEFLARGTVDVKVLLENAQRAGQLRMYATRLKTGFEAQIAVEISATWLDDRVEPVMALVIRNASSAMATRADPVSNESDMRGVMELVGSSTLKDIVSDTTNVIEKICIETAIELTRNNRVAAAEMLGLSRQSLYVKLRKYGMLSREDE